MSPLRVAISEESTSLWSLHAAGYSSKRDTVHTQTQRTISVRYFSVFIKEDHEAIAFKIVFEMSRSSLSTTNNSQPIAMRTNNQINGPQFSCKVNVDYTHLDLNSSLTCKTVFKEKFYTLTSASIFEGSIASIVTSSFLSSLRLVFSGVEVCGCSRMAKGIPASARAAWEKTGALTGRAPLCGTTTGKIQTELYVNKRKYVQAQ